MFKVPIQAINIISKLQASGFDAVIAGGWVRDQLLNIPSNDIDIATSATPDQVASLFDNVKFVGKDFGVSLVTIDNMEFEVATFRKDGPYSDGSHPDYVDFCGMEEDAKRRDLTINALFYDPIDDKIFDFVGGEHDIEHKIIRFVGIPEHRIKEDHVRMLRAIRFANRFNFILSDTTSQRLREYANLIENVAKERIAREMNKILEQCDSFVFKQLNHYGLLKYIIPELEASIGCEQPPQFHPEGDVWTHTMIVFDYMKTLDPELECLWAALLHDIGKPPTALYDEKDKRWRFNNHDIEGTKITRDILTRLKFSCHFIDRVCDLVANHMRFANVEKMKKSKLKRFIFMPYFDDHCKLHKADCMGSHGEFGHIEFCEQKRKEFKEEHIEGLPKPLITGYDLINLDLDPGPIFKEILEQCMDHQLENPSITYDELKKYLITILPE